MNTEQTGKNIFKDMKIASKQECQEIKTNGKYCNYKMICRVSHFT